ncbi:MAG: type II toxin-antitoxin system RelE/ParE family toxin [Dongiaceae bacterium]
MAEREFRFHTAAAKEADGALAWYAAHSPLAAAGFLSELEHAVARVREAPERWPRIASGTRRYVFPRFPFSLVYRFTDTKVEVIAVAHHRRKPGYWASR